MDPAPKSSISPAARRAVDLRFVELMDKVRRNRPGDDLELLRRAFDFAAEQHKTQTRLSGEPFLSHPVEVAHLLADMRLDVTATPKFQSRKLTKYSARTSRGWWKAPQKSAGSTFSLRKRDRPKTFARCCSPWSTTCAS